MLRGEREYKRGKKGLGEVFKPEDVVKKERRIADLPSTPIHRPTNLDALVQEIVSIKRELTKIKVALRAHGITYD
jgi:hypothetical protein